MVYSNLGKILIGVDWCISYMYIIKSSVKDYKKYKKICSKHHKSTLSVKVIQTILITFSKARKREIREIKRQILNKLQNRKYKCHQSMNTLNINYLYK